MKTKSPNHIKRVERLSELKKLLNTMAKEEASIRAEIKRIMGDELVLEAGPFIVILSERTRRDVDKEKLLADKGQDFVDKYLRETRYQILEIKKRGAS